MKRTLLALGLLSVLALPVTGLAQSAVPLNISYQGKVTDAAGALIGTGTPVNREVIFRLYDSPTSTTILYSERQNVTIANGEFSVLIGQGATVGTEPRPALDTVFGSAQRYLGVTVDDGNPGVDLEISPRQQIVATPFAFRARIAEGLTTNAVSNTTMIANNAVTGVNIADSAITSSKIAAGTVATANLADAAINSAKIADASIATADLANGAVTAAKLASDVGVWSVTGSNLFRNSSIGIGTSTIQAGDRLTISGGNLRLDNFRYLAFTTGVDDFTHNGVNMTQYGIGSFIDSDLGGSAALWLSAWQGFKFFAAGAPRMVIRSDGNVGIGTSGGTASARLDIGGNTNNAIQAIFTRGADDRFRLVAQNRSVDNNPGSEVARFGIGYNGGNVMSGFAFNRGAGSDDTDVLTMTNGLVRTRVHGDGRIGLTGANPDGAVQVFIGNTPGRAYPFVIGTSVGGNFLFEHNGNAYKSTGSSWSISSDARLKTDIQDLSGSLESLLRLHSVNFRFKDETRYAPGLQVGFIAQEVEKVFPSWVSDGPDGFKAITVKGFEAHTVQALRELRAEKDAQIAALTARAEAAEARLAALEQQVAALVAASKR